MFPIFFLFLLCVSTVVDRHFENYYYFFFLIKNFYLIFKRVLNIPISNSFAYPSPSTNRDRCACVTIEIKMADDIFSFCLRRVGVLRTRFHPSSSSSSLPAPPLLPHYLTFYLSSDLINWTAVKKRKKKKIHSFFKIVSSVKREFGKKIMREREKYD